MKQSVSIPQGTRDFLPLEMAKRNYIFNTIKDVFCIYGYQPIETPALENLSTLMGKYGEEGDKLLFKILNSGDFLSSVSETELSERNTLRLASKLCDRGLRYDLTVPFARFVVKNRNELTFPFKRYQIQPVWRADRPQKGRYREFYQCDADVVGSDSLMNEVELIQIIDTVFNRLNINVDIKINNRKILAGIAEVIGEADKLVDITVAIDKLDKIGLDKVKDELLAKGIQQSAIEKLIPFLLLQGEIKVVLASLQQLLAESEIGVKGVEELAYIFAKLDLFDIRSKVSLDLSLARGLNYYTGAIFEVKALDVMIGSITGGGRYDNLTGIFGLPNVSGVGISFGADRIYDVLNQLELYPEDLTSSAHLLFVNFGEKEVEFLLPVIAKLRSKGVAVELYPDAAKLKKQFSYADGKNIPFVAIAGESEMNQGKIVVKCMTSGEQTEYTIEELLNRFC